MPDVDDRASARFAEVVEHAPGLARRLDAARERDEPLLEVEVLDVDDEQGRHAGVRRGGHATLSERRTRGGDRRATRVEQRAIMVAPAQLAVGRFFALHAPLPMPPNSKTPVIASPSTLAPKEIVACWP